MGMVRRINEAGTTVILVEQSLNRAAQPGRSGASSWSGRDPLRRSHGRPHGAATTSCARSSWGSAVTGLLAPLPALSSPTSSRSRGSSSASATGCSRWGLVLVYRTNRVLNFAQGQIGVIAAVFLVKLTADFKFNYWFAPDPLRWDWPPSVGVLSELVLRRLFNRPRVLVMVATIGLSYAPRPDGPAVHPAPNLYKPVPVPFDLSFSLGPVHLHARPRC